MEMTSQWCSSRSRMGAARNPPPKMPLELGRLAVMATECPAYRGHVPKDGLGVEPQAGHRLPPARRVSAAALPPHRSLHTSARQLRLASSNAEATPLQMGNEPGGETAVPQDTWETVAVGEQE
ncbi:MAG TPA: hypothetical protein VGW38_04950 [Chloroflexota bacterium]|nr:hypothetical protein [Chloroflexota bacterium]